MIRLLVRTAVLLVANAVGLIVAAAVLDGMTLDATGFIIAVVVFTVVMALLQPFLAACCVGAGRRRSAGSHSSRHSPPSSSRASLTEGLSIDGIGTWIAAAVIVWVAALLAAFILPFLGLKKYLENN